MADIASKSEVIAMAFQRPIAESRIEDGLINAIQVRYILPILGEDFYDAVILTPASYTALLVYLKPIVAHYVRYHILPEIFVEVSNTGLNKIPGNNRVAGATEDLGSLRQSALDIASFYVTALTKYLNDNYASYPLYYGGTNPENRIDIAGGIIMKKDFLTDDFYSTKND